MGAVDGPGVRFVTFMQGCPLRCAYCHNPDTWDYGKGSVYSVEEVVAKLTRFIPYIKNGGLTVSGGEPLSQIGFVQELFIRAHELGLHTALDTSGIGDLHEAERLLEHTDLVLLDIKFTNCEDYSKYAEADFTKVRAFLDLCGRKQQKIWIRQVIVTGINDDLENIEQLCKIIEPYSKIVEKVELLPFRKICLAKYDSMGLKFPFAHIGETTEAKIDELNLWLEAKSVR